MQNALLTMPNRLKVDSRVRGMAGSVVQYGGVATTSGSAVVTMTSTTGLAAGASFVAQGVPYAARVLTVDSGTQVTLTANATSTGTGRKAAAWQPPVMASPPTLSYQTSRWFAAGASTQTSPPNDGLTLRTGGQLGSFFGPSSDYQVVGPLNIGGTRTPQNTATLVAFDFDGDVFEFGFPSAGAAGLSPGFRLWVNEQCVAPGLTVGNVNTNSTTWVKVDFGARAYRRILIEVASAQGSNSNTYVQSIATPIYNSILPPTVRTSRIAHLGDSHGQCAGAPDYTSGYVPLYARMLGFQDVWNMSISGTGPATANGSGASNFTDYTNRIADVIAAGADLVVIQGSVNDVNAYPGNAAAISANTAALISQISAGLPNSGVVVTGPLFSNTPSANLIAVSGLYQAAAAAAGVPFIDTLGQVAPASPWFVGTSTWGTPNSSGNADFYSYDATHVVQPGHWYQARRMALAISRLYGLDIEAA